MVHLLTEIFGLVNFLGTVLRQAISLSPLEFVMLFY